MHIQVVTTRTGQGTCPVCHEVRRRVEVRVTSDVGGSRGVEVCENCIVVPGISFGVDLSPPPTSHAGRRLSVVKNEERQTAREIGGVKTLASGAVHGDGDAKNERWMVEEKRTEADSYRLSGKTLLKAMAQAAKQGKDWVFKIRLPKHGIVLAVMRWDSALSLINGREDETA